MHKEIYRVLKMVEDGKVSAEEGFRLIGALEEKLKTHGGKPKFLKIKVESDDDRVNLVLPLPLLRWAARFIPKGKRELLEEKDIDLNEVTRLIEEGARGEIVSIEDSDGDVVKIWVE